MSLTDAEILSQLDLAFQGEPSEYFPIGQDGDVRYNFFLDFENGYFHMAGNRIHVYSDATRWAIVFEKCGYHNRKLAAEIELISIGNCIAYQVSSYAGRNYITNLHSIELIDSSEFSRIEKKGGKGFENFEMINPAIDKVAVRGVAIPFETNHKQYEAIGIKIRDYDNPEMLVGFGDFVRYLDEVYPDAIRAKENDIRQQIPMDLPKLLTIEKFHFESVHDKRILPSTQETFRLISKVIVTGDSSYWAPTQSPNNHWSNWISGHL